MNINKNSSNYNGEERLEVENSKIAVIVSSSNKEKQKLHKKLNISEEEKKQQNREKNKIRMQRYRANLSDEQKQQVREKERLKRQQERQTISEEERSKRREENALQHRNKYQEENSFMQKYFDKKDEEVDDDEEYENEVEANNIEEDQVQEDDDDAPATNRVKDWALYREKRNAQSRIYKRARYAQLKEAEKTLQTISEDGTDKVQQLHLLANRRQQILQYARNYRQTHHHRSWVPIPQVWDEDNPCR